LKYLGEGEALYVGGKVKVEDSLLSRKERKKLEKELEPLLRPLPNKKFLGLRPKLYFYNIAGEPKRDKGFRYWLRNKVGEPPVYSVRLIWNITKVFFKTIPKQRLFQGKNRIRFKRNQPQRKVTAEYIVRPGKQYKIKSVKFPSDSSVLSKNIAQLQRRSRLKVGDAYSLDNIKDERERIDTRLKEKGYYYFSPDFILVQVDSTVGKQEVDLIVKVKSETPETFQKNLQD